MTTEEKESNKIPMSPLLIMLIQQIQEETQKKISKAIELGAKLENLPEKTQADLSNGVWILPPIAPG